MSRLDFLVRTAKGAHLQQYFPDCQFLLIADKVVLLEELLAVMTFDEQVEGVP